MKFSFDSYKLKTVILVTFLSLFISCATTVVPSEAVSAPPSSDVKSEVRAIAIKPNSPAETVQIFYKRLKEKKIREAIFMTNLRPAVEGLSDAELKEFQVDFDELAMDVPGEIVITGEVISGDKATVIARLPNDDPEKFENSELNLRKENNSWVILTVDDAAEKVIKKEGKRYFHLLRISTHHDEAREMLNRISKAQMAYSIQNGGKFADLKTLVESQFVPSDALSAESTGYKYEVLLTDDRATYSATATPSEYDRSGKLSFLVRLDDSKSPLLSAKDVAGKTLTKEMIGKPGK